MKLILLSFLHKQEVVHVLVRGPFMQFHTRNHSSLPSQMQQLLHSFPLLVRLGLRAALSTRTLCYSGDYNKQFICPFKYLV